MPGPQRFQFQCLRCRSVLEARAEQCGSQGKCPSCGGVFTVPARDPRSGLALSNADPGEDGELPIPVHAYAAAGEQAPRIRRRQDDSLAIICPRCDSESSITADSCPECGLPFTMEGATGTVQTSESSLCQWALGVGLIAVLCSFCSEIGILIAVVAIILAVLSWDRRGHRMPVSAIVGLAFGVIAVLITLSPLVLR